MLCKSSGSLSLLKQQICTFCVAPNICNSAATKYISVASGLTSQSSLIVTGSIQPSNIAHWGVFRRALEGRWEEKLCHWGQIGWAAVFAEGGTAGNTVDVSENKQVSSELNSGKMKMKAWGNKKCSLISKKHAWDKVREGYTFSCGRSLGSSCSGLDSTDLSYLFVSTLCVLGLFTRPSPPQKIHVTSRFLVS